MMNELWIKIKDMNQLYVEEELVVGVETILFTCVSDNQEKYLVMTYDSYEGQYVIIKITNEKLLEMLQQKITIEQTFRQGEEILLTKWNEKLECLDYERYQSEEFPDEMLPEKGVYYTIKSQYILDYIKELSEKCYVDKRYTPQILVRETKKEIIDEYYVFENDKAKINSEYYCKENSLRDKCIYRKTVNQVYVA